MLPVLPADRRRSEPAPDWSEPWHLCLRSEAFAEDLAEASEPPRTDGAQTRRELPSSVVLLSLALLASTGLGGVWLVR